MEGGPLAGLQSSLASALPSGKPGGGHPAGAGRHMSPFQFPKIPGLGGLGGEAGGAAAGGEAAGGLAELAPLAAL